METFEVLLINKNPCFILNRMLSCIIFQKSVCIFTK